MTDGTKQIETEVAERIITEEIACATGPTDGWLDSPKAIAAAILLRLKMRSKDAPAQVPTDPSKRYWITEQGMKEAAAEICVGKGRCPICAWELSDIPGQGCDLETCSFCTEDVPTQKRLTARLAKWKEAIQSIAAHSEAASPPDAEQFLESLPARETFPINRTETAELLTKFADWLLRRPVPTFTMCSADIGKVSPVIVEAAAPPQGTPAPETCQICEEPSRTRKWVCSLPVNHAGDHRAYLMHNEGDTLLESWHSTVAAQTDPFSKGYKTE